MDYHGTDGEDIFDQASLGAAAGANVYGGGGNDKITLTNGIAIGEAGNDTIVSAGTSITAAYWGAPSAITVDLQVGAAQDGYGSTDILIGIHNVHASSFNDTLLGSSAADIFWGSAGDDYIDGRGGVDTVSFFFSSSTKFSISYDTTNDLVIVKNTDPAGSNFGTKTLKNVEILQFDDVSILTSSLNPNYKITLSPTKSAVLSVAGIWAPNSASDPVTHNGISLANVFYSQITLANGRNGLVLNGWSYNGWDNQTFYPVTAAVLEQNSDGRLTVATNKYLPDSGNNGSGSVLVADFNNDGKQDIFLPAHNESPFIAKPSTAYLSNVEGSFSRTILSDSIEAHGGIVGDLNGVPTVFVASYGGDRDPYYQFIQGAFVQTANKTNGFVGGCSVAVADFNGDGIADAVYADCNYGPGITNVPGSSQLIVVYKLSDAVMGIGAPEVQLIPFFNDKAEYSAIQSLNGYGQTHTYRVWVDDFNHDGKTDILAGGSLWSSSEPNQNYSILQLLQNTSSIGAISFSDKTELLNGQYTIKSLEVDYSMQLVDIDRSGINAYLIAGGLYVPRFADGSPDNSKQTNYILLNDGTGQLHIYMHDQFQALGEQVNAYLAITNGGQPRFIEYQTENGCINLVAELSISTVINGNSVSQEEFINVPLQLDPTTDYTENTIISDRNGSTLMRTWAGNDIFYDKNSNSALTSIDGGLGIDISAYSNARLQYQITPNSDGTWGVIKSGAIADTLKNIDRLQFSNTKLALDLKPTEHAGQALEFIGTLVPSLIGSPSTVGLILGLIDKGSSLRDVFQLALDVGFVNSIAGSNTNTALAAMAFRNLKGFEISDVTLDLLVGFMDGRHASYSQADFLSVIAGLEINQIHIGLVGLQQLGIEYI